MVIILEIELLASDAQAGEGVFAPARSVKVALDDLLNKPGVYLQYIREVGSDFLPEGSELKRLAYQDDDGDWCTLMDSTVPDATKFAKPQDGCERKLQVLLVSQKSAVVAEPKAEERSAPAPSAACSQIIVQVQLMSFNQEEGAWSAAGRVFHVDASQAVDHQDAFMMELDKRAKQVDPGYRALKYSDDDGDWCILSAASVSDAVCLAIPLDQCDDSSPPIRCLTLRVTPAPASQSAEQEPMQEPMPPAQDDQQPVHCDEGLRLLNELAADLDLRKLVPKLAGAALHVVDEVQLPALFPLIDMLCAFRDGELKADNLPALLPQAIGAIFEVPHDRRQDLLLRLKSAAEAAAEELRREQARTETSIVEVHQHIICDGCNSKPLIGARFKSLTHDDFDLCQACYDKEDRDSKAWVRVRSGVTGEVISSFFGDAHASKPVHHHVECDKCGLYPIVGARFKCLDIHDFDLCETCKAKCAEDPEMAGRRFEEVKAATISVSGSCLRSVEVAEATSEEAAPPDAKNESAAADATAAVETSSEEVLRAAFLALLQHEDPAIRSISAEALRVAGAKVGSESDQISVHAPSEGSWDVQPEGAWAETGPALEQETSRPAATIVGMTAPLVFGIEAMEETAAQGDATEEFGGILQSMGASEAFRLGRILLPVVDAGTSQDEVPVCAKVALMNSGNTTWPETAAISLVAGNDLGFPHLALGSMQPGEPAEIVMDLLIPHKHSGDAARSAWAVVDTATGAPLGPILILEVLWQAP